MPIVRFSPSSEFGTFKWGQLDTGEAGEVARLLYHSGLIHPGSIDALTKQKMMRVRSLGFLRELDLYKAWQYTELKGRMVTIPGIQLWSYGEGQLSAPSYGPKDLKLSVKDSQLGQISIEDISSDYHAGLYPLKYRYPSLFSWDRGEWERILGVTGLDANGATKVTGIDGSANDGYARVKVADSDADRPYVFPENDIVEFVEVTGRLDATEKILNVGSLALSYDSGPEVALNPWFEDIISWDGANLSTRANNLTGKLSENFNKSGDIIQNTAGDSFYIGSSQPFYGFELFASSWLGVGETIEIMFSNRPHVSENGAVDTGFSADFWSSVTDETSALNEDGSIYWDDTAVVGWTKANLIYDDGAEKQFLQYYWIKVKVTSATPGTLTALTLRRHLRLPGSKGDYITVKVDPEALRLKESDESLVIRPDSNGVATPSSWHRFVSMDKAITELADVARFRGEILDQDDIKINLNSRYMNVYSDLPGPDYYQRITASFVDSDDNDRVYLGIGKELWSYEQQGSLQFLGKIVNKTDPAGTLDDLTFTSIQRIVKDGNVVKGVAWTSRRDVGTGRSDSAAVTFTYTVSTDTFAYSQVNDGIYGVMPSKEVSRIGTVHAAGGPTYFRYIGQGWVGDTFHGGENMTIPFEQDVYTEAASASAGFLSVQVHSRDGNTSSTGLDYPIWIFEPTMVGVAHEPNYEEGPYWHARPGVYAVNDGVGTVNENDKDRIGFRYSVGQKGMVEYHFNDDNWYCFERRDQLNTDTIRLRPAGGGAGSFEDCIFFYPSINDGDPTNTNPNVLAGQFPDAAADKVYLSYIIWNEEDVAGTLAESVSYFSLYQQDGKAKDWPKAFHYNITGALYTDKTTVWNAGTGGAATLDAQYDAVYVGDTTTFNSVYFSVTNSAFNATVLLQYWNGSAWTTIDASLQNDNTSELTTDGHWTWSPPADWAETAVSPGAITQYWIRFQVDPYVSGSTVIDGAQNAWTNYWESRAAIAGANRDCEMITDFCHNPNEGTIHACVFDRDITAGSNPGEYAYLVIELSTLDYNYSQTGDNFLFDPIRPIKGFIYNSTDFNIYSIATSLADFNQGSWLLKCDFTGGNTIELENVGIAPGGAYDLEGHLSVDSDGGMYGVVGGNENVLWQYSDVIWPRVHILNMGDMDVSEAIVKLCQASNFVVQVTSERVLTIQGRLGKTTPGTFTAGRKQLIDVRPSKKYQHIYRAVTVSWSNGVDSGVENYGDVNSKGAILSVNNEFIQSPYYARILARMLFDYFKNVRYVFQADMTYLLQLELGDELTFSVPSSVAGIDTTKEWIVWGLDLDTTNKKLLGTFLEKV